MRDPWFIDNEKCKEIKKILLDNDCWCGDLGKIVVSECNDIAPEVTEDDLETKCLADIILSFTSIDKQCYTTITCAFMNHGGQEFYDIYFLTWYDNRPFEVFTKNGKEIMLEEYQELLNLLKICGFDGTIKEDNSITYIKKEINRINKVILKRPYKVNIS